MAVTNIYCVGRNYLSHAREMGNTIPDEPIFFQKSSVCYSENPVILLPPNREIHYELEIVVRIGKSGFKVPKEIAWNCVDGICLGLDLTDRKLQQELKQERLPWFLAKSFQDSAVVTQFEPVDLKYWGANFWLKQNTTLVQSANMNEMIFDIPTLITFLSKRIPMTRGDIIFTGTPDGVGPLYEGDQLTLGLGNKIKGRFSVITEE